MSLILHCGARHVTRNEIERLPTPRPQGPRHQPVHHADFLTTLDTALADGGYIVTEEAFGISQNQAQLFGVVRVETPWSRGFHGGSFVIGVRGSVDKSLSQALAAGTNVFVCDNLAFNGQVEMTTKSTTFVRGRLPGMVDRLVERLGIFFERASQQVDSYRLSAISDDRAAVALVELGKRGVINWSELGKVWGEWEDPKHEEHAEDGKNVWRFFNAATEAMKLRNPEHPRLPHLAPKTVQLHKVCDELAWAA